MKVKLEQILLSKDLLQQIVGQKLNGAAAFKVFSLIKEVEHQLKSFDEARSKIITNNEGTLEKDAKEYTFPSPEAKEKADNEFVELVTTEVELHCRPLTLTDLEKVQEITSQEIALLTWAIED